MAHINRKGEWLFSQAPESHGRFSLDMHTFSSKSSFEILRPELFFSGPWSLEEAEVKPRLSLFAAQFVFRASDLM